MKTITRLIMVVAVALMVSSMPAVAVEDEHDFVCYPFICE